MKNLQDIIDQFILRENIKLPIMNCHGCIYRQEGWRDSGHCYMFRYKPKGDRCGQFKDNRESGTGKNISCGDIE